MDSFRGVMRSLAPRGGHLVHSRGTHSSPFDRGAGFVRDKPDAEPQESGLVAKARNMKPIIWVGILLIVLGGLALAYQGFTYTHQEKVLDLGPIHATREDHEWVSVPPVLGGLALVGGIALLVVGGKKGS